MILTLEKLMAPFRALVNARVERRQDLASMVGNLAELREGVTMRMTRQLTAECLMLRTDGMLERERFTSGRTLPTSFRQVHCTSQFETESL